MAAGVCWQQGMRDGMNVWWLGQVPEQSCLSVEKRCIPPFQKIQQQWNPLQKIGPGLNANPVLFLIAWLLLIAKPVTPHWKVYLAASKPKARFQ